MFPRLQTRRLVLDGFTASDAPMVELLAGDADVARWTANIPHPYPPGAALAWISTHAAAHGEGRGVTFAIRGPDGLAGAVSLVCDPIQRMGELGYWIGKPYWNRGYCTEAAAACVAHGFGALGLRRVWARHLAANPASGRVMARIGMRREGVLRAHAMRDGVISDLVVYGLLASDPTPAAEFP